ncbi:hypothetical protein N8286_00790 [bacterium]|nr:hypothetical protein [bacterium]
MVDGLHGRSFCNPAKKPLGLSVEFCSLLFDPRARGHQQWAWQGQIKQVLPLYLGKLRLKFGEGNV